MKQIRRGTYSLNLHTCVYPHAIEFECAAFPKKMKAHEILKASLTEKVVEVLILQK